MLWGTRVVDVRMQMVLNMKKNNVKHRERRVRKCRMRKVTCDMNLIGTKTGVPKKQQRITHQGKQLTTRRAFKPYSSSRRNRDEDDRPTEQAALDTEEREEI